MSGQALELRIKESPEDFLVEERLAHAPSGTGEHLMLFVEKRELTTSAVVAHLARTYELRARDIGYAGRKDRRAVTRQWFSLAGVDSARAPAAEAPGLRVLEVSRNERKLRVGALAGNRFELLLRGASEADRPRIAATLERLRERGLPNRFGPQRFGADGRAHVLGELLLAREWRGFLAELAGSSHWPASAELCDLREVLGRAGREGHRGLERLTRGLPRELAPIAKQLARRRGDFTGAVRALDRALVNFGISALQARLFNAVLSLRAEGYDRPELGDLLQLHPGRGYFVVEDSQDSSELRARAARRELSPTGPIFGWKAQLAQHEPGRAEADVLAGAGLELPSFKRILTGLSPEGSRRSLRAPIEDLRAEWQPQALCLRFGLPPGSYATTLVEELAAG